MFLNVINLDTNQPVNQYASPDRKMLILRNREERILSVVRQSKALGIKLRIWEGETSHEKFPCINISRAFKKIVRYAKEERLPYVTIAEDDIVFTSPHSWRYYIENIPDDFDLYLGGIYAGQLDGNRIVNGYSGHTLITVHERFYDFFLGATNETIISADSHLDVWLGKHCREKKYVVCTPFVCKQLGGYSENKNAIMDYSTMYESAWDYLT